MKPHIQRLVDAAHAEIVKELVEPGKVMTSPAVFADYVQQKMEKYKNSECLGILYCNSQNGVIGFEIEEKGEKFGAFCDPRRIAMACLEKATQGVFLAINHTSGDGMASKEDLSLTERVTVILGKLQIQCLDSAILKMGRGCYSMEEHGIMPTKNDQAIASVGENMAPPEGQIKQDGKMEEPSRALVKEARKALEEELRDPEVCVRRPVDVVPYIQLSLAHHLHRECFAVMFCDAQMNMIHWEEVFLGTIDGCAVYPREVARLCLEKGAKAIYLAHNHPSGEVSIGRIKGLR